VKGAAAPFIRAYLSRRAGIRWPSFRPRMARMATNYDCKRTFNHETHEKRETAFWIAGNSSLCFRALGEFRGSIRDVSFRSSCCDPSVVLALRANVKSLESLKILEESLALGAESLRIPAESLANVDGARGSGGCLRPDCSESQ